MATPRSLHPQYLTDEQGRKHSVVLPLAEFEELLEDLYDLARVAERRDEPTLPHADLIARLTRENLR